MNDKLQEQIAKLVEQGMAAGKSALQVIEEQAPALAEEFLRWKAIEHAVLTAAGALLLLFALACAVRVFKESKRDIFKQSDALMVGGPVAAVISTLIGLALIAGNGLAAIQVHVAPKVYLLEYFTK